MAETGKVFTELLVVTENVFFEIRQNPIPNMMYL